MAKKRKSKKQKGRELTSERVIDMDERRAARRRALREEAEKSRSKRGEKSMTQEMLDDMARGDEQIIEQEKKEKTEQALKEKRAKREKEKKPKPMLLRFCIIVMVVVSFLVLFKIGTIVKLEFQKMKAEAEVERLQEEKESLELQVSQIGTDEYMQKQAREWLRMAEQGELIYESDRNSASAESETTDEAVEADNGE